MISLLMQHVLTALADRKGITSLEYGVLAVGIVLTVATAATALGGNLTTLFGNIGKAL